jgi:serine/threonine protein kinase
MEEFKRLILFICIDTRTGTGTFGRVRLCLHKETHQYYCMKILRKQIIYRYKQIQHLKNERDVLKNVQHPGIVRLYALFTILHFHFEVLNL